MLPKGFFISLLVFVFGIGQAQNWACFDDRGIPSYFWGEDDQLYTLAIDSTDTLGLIYNFGEWGADDACGTGNFNYPNYSFRSLTWLGGGVEKRPDGTYVFRNLTGRPIYIFTRATVGQQWAMYMNTVDTLFAKVLSIDIDTVFGSIPDSVMTIRLNYARGGIHLDQNFQQWDGELLRLSKTFGLLDFPKMNSFPDKLLMTKTQRQPIKRYDVYNYSVGDRFQIRSSEYQYGLYTIYYYKLYTVLAVSRIGITSITYTMQVETITFSNGNINTTIDTITNTQNSLDLFVMGPITRKPEPHAQSIRFPIVGRGVLGNNDRISGVWGQVTDEFYPLGNGCWQHTQFVDGGGDITYYEGVGPLETQWGIGGTGGEYLVYYESAGKSYGEIHTGLADTELPELEVSIYPTPASKTLFIKLPGSRQVHLQLVNSLGQTVYETEGNPPGIDVSGYPEGLYFLRLEARGQVAVKKVLIQH